MGFKYLRNIEGSSTPVMIFVKPTSTVANQPKPGDAVTIASGLAQKAVTASTNILGIAVEGVSTNVARANAYGNHGDEILVIVDERATYQVPYAGTTKTSLADADRFTAFDLDDAGTLDLDTKTTGQFMVLDFDNVAKTAVVINKKNTI